MMFLFFVITVLSYASCRAMRITAVTGRSAANVQRSGQCLVTYHYLPPHKWPEATDSNYRSTEQEQPNTSAATTSHLDTVMANGGDTGTCSCIQMQSLLAMVQMLQSSHQALQAQVSGMSTDARQQSDRMENLRAIVSDSNVSLTSQLQFVQNRLSSLALPGKVAFSAKMAPSSYGVNVSNNSPFVFGVVVTNIGDAYNRDTGLFTAPYDGVYVFQFIVINYREAPTIHLVIVKNEEVLAAGISFGIGDYNLWDDASALVTTRLSVGDRVYVRRKSGGTHINGGEFCNFSGFILGPAM